MNEIFNRYKKHRTKIRSESINVNIRQSIFYTKEKK
jgi:hypothetical protein